MKLLKINDIVLDEPLFFNTEFQSTEFQSATQTALNGDEIVFINKAKARNLSVSSKDTAWISKKTLDALISLANISAKNEIFLSVGESKADLGTPKEKKLTARFDYSSGAVSAEPLFTGSDLFKISIALKEI